jgi:hypothetical protein
MSKFNINKLDSIRPDISFLVRNQNDTGDSTLTPYTLTYQKKTVSGWGTATKEFTNAYFVPLNTLIKFTPVYNGLGTDNKIIQCKWSFGDGIDIFIPATDDPAKSVFHSYNFSYNNSTETNACINVKLTVVDSYQRTITCQKTVYPKP